MLTRYLVLVILRMIFSSKVLATNSNVPETYRIFEMIRDERLEHWALGQVRVGMISAYGDMTGY